MTEKVVLCSQSGVYNPLGLQIIRRGKRDFLEGLWFLVGGSLVTAYVYFISYHIYNYLKVGVRGISKLKRDCRLECLVIHGQTLSKSMVIRRNLIQ
jgi:hypothetical protein